MANRPQHPGSVGSSTSTSVAGQATPADEADLRSTFTVARRYHRLISGMEYGNATEACWHDDIVMVRSDGREYSGVGTCTAWLASALRRAEVIRIVFEEPVVGATGFLMLVKSRQHLKATAASPAQSFETVTIYNHDVADGRIVRITAYLTSLDLLTEAGDEVGGTVVARHRVPWLEAIQWLGEHRI
jgi:ketosteroid isomerase-like protein